MGLQQESAHQGRSLQRPLTCVLSASRRLKDRRAQGTSPWRGRDQPPSQAGTRQEEAESPFLALSCWA